VAGGTVVFAPSRLCGSAVSPPPDTPNKPTTLYRGDSPALDSFYERCRRKARALEAFKADPP
jgi:hypothetical protein